MPSNDKTVGTDKSFSYAFTCWSLAPIFGWGIDTELLPVSAPLDADLPTPAYHPIFTDTGSLSPQAQAAQDHNYYIASAQDSGSAGKDVKLVFPTQNDVDQRTFSIGPNTFLIDFHGSLETDPRIPTVPFGFNLGYKDRYNGTVVLGRSYDANRVASTSWRLLNETATGNAFILASGVQGLQVAFTSLDSLSMRTTFQVSQIIATMDFNNDSIILPHHSSFQCTSILVVAPPEVHQPDAPGAIMIHPNITKDTCYKCEAEDTDQTIVLEKPFFQAAYIYMRTRMVLYTLLRRTSMTFRLGRSLSTRTVPSSLLHLPDLRRARRVHCRHQAHLQMA